MKKLPSIKATMALVTIPIAIFSTSMDGNIIKNQQLLINDGYILAKNPNFAKMPYNQDNTNLFTLNEVQNIEQREVPEIVYDGMTLDELGEKLEINLKSTLKGYGHVLAEYALNYEVDPYLSLAIILHETGCYSGQCSSLARKCNNIGGMKGSPGCGGGSYKKYKTLDAGIEAFFKNLSKNYYQKGLTTPEKIGKKYAQSTTWASRVKYYINMIKNS